MSPLDLDGALRLIRRSGQFDRKEIPPAEPRQPLQAMVIRQNPCVDAGVRLKAWLDDTDRHWQR